MTDRYAVIGHPVAHSKSPWIHAEFARACGQNIEYTRIEAPLDGFTRAVDAFRAAGGRAPYCPVQQLKGGDPVSHSENRIAVTVTWTSAYGVRA